MTVIEISELGRPGRPGPAERPTPKPESGEVLIRVAAEYVQLTVDALALEGRLVQIPTLGGAKAHVNMASAMQRRLTITGSTLRGRSVDGVGHAHRQARPCRVTTRR